MSLSSQWARLRALPFSALIDELAPLLQKVLDGFPPQHRCLFPPAAAFWIFLHQVLSGLRSCRESLEAYRAWRAARGLKVPSEDTGAYCKARGRLIPAMFQAIQGHLRRMGREVEKRYGRWRGRPVVIVDATTFTLPDTPENQARYPQPSSQKPGGGFPLLRMVGLFSYATGMLVEEACGPYTAGELTLFRSGLRAKLPTGTVLLSDRVLSSYADLVALRQEGVDFVVRRHPARTTGARLCRELGAGDRLVWWTQGQRRPPGVAKADWDALPGATLWREVSYTVEDSRSAEITVVTSLLDAERYPKEAVAELFGDRWQVETHFDQIKTILGAETLSCQSPEMIEKELTVYLMAYNLIRFLMLQSARAHDLRPKQISFGHAVTMVRQWGPYLAGVGTAQRQRLYEELLRSLAHGKLPHRPGRREPRAVKRRPKNYARLTQPRHEFQEIVHRDKYRRDR